MWPVILAAPLLYGTIQPPPAAPPAWQAAPMPYSQPRPWIPPALPPSHPSLMLDPNVMRPR